eukprot:m.115638 g.115638  ORF g.115638 m.115638 type:complete len:63 (+) comp28437_c4_seq1:924-1112(+)
MDASKEFTTGDAVNYFDQRSGEVVAASVAKVRVHVLVVYGVIDGVADAASVAGIAPAAGFTC